MIERLKNSSEKPPTFSLRQATEEDPPFLFKVSTDAMRPVVETLNPDKVFDEEQGVLNRRKERAREIVGFCYGLADALEQQPQRRQETVERLRAIAARYVPREQYEAIKTRRLDEKGRFKFSADEVA